MPKMVGPMTSFELPEEIDPKVRDVVLCFTYGSKISLNAARIMKLAYLAELRAIETWGRRLTSAEFKHWNYGPWSPDVALAMEGVPELRVEVKETSKGRKGKFFHRTQRSATLSSLTEEEADLLKGVLSYWEHVPNDRLVEATKKSPPFIWTEFGDAIPFEEYEDFAARLRRARDDTLEEVIELNSKEDVRAFVKNLN